MAFMGFWEGSPYPGAEVEEENNAANIIRILAGAFGRVLTKSSSTGERKIHKEILQRTSPVYGMMESICSNSCSNSMLSSDEETAHSSIV